MNEGAQLALTILVCVIACGLIAGCDRALTNDFDLDPDLASSNRDLITHLAHAQKRKPTLRFYNHRKHRQPVKTAQDVTKEGFRVRNNPPIFPRPPIDWADNPKSDSNWLFQKNAMYMAAPFFQAHIETKNTQYLDVLQGLMLDWIKYHNQLLNYNPMQWLDMATGLRAVYLAYIIDQRLRESSLDYHALETLLGSAVEHADELADPSKLNANNHAYFQLTGLAALCNVIDSLRDCSARLEYATSAMERVFFGQFSSEGMHREHAPGYHYYSLIRAQAIFETGWFELSDEVTRRLQLARENSAWLVHPNGWTAMIGDTDRVNPKAWSSTQTPADDGILFRQSGIAVLRFPSEPTSEAQQSYIYFWAGEERPGEMVAHSHSHSHADNFTFEWSAANVPILIDSGKYTYEDNPWRSFFTSTRAHNTIEIDGQSFENALDIEDPELGPFFPRITAFESNALLQYVQAEAIHLPSNVTHNRLIVTHPNRWLVVVDQLEGSKTHEFTQWFHFEEQWALDTINDTTLIGRRNSDQLHIQSLPPVKSTTYLGVEEPMRQGWISPRYQERTPRYALGLSQVGNETTFVTRFLLNTEGASSDTMYKTRGQRAFSVCWGTAGHKQGFQVTHTGKITHCD